MPVKVRREIRGIRGDECDCGRRASIIHCNACGSTRVYARSNREHEFLNGEVKFVAVQFRCQTCGHLFITEERQFCDAPPISEALAKLKVQRLHEAAQRGEYLHPQDTKLAQHLGFLPTPVDGSETEDSPVLAEQESILAKAEADIIQKDPSIATVVLPQPHPDDFVPPNGLNKREYNVADRAFRLEWAQKKLLGQAPTKTVEEYVERRLKGELFE